MSIGADLARIKGAKQSLRTAIEGKGVVVPAATRLDEYHSYVDAISGGGGMENLMPMTFTGAVVIAGGVTVTRDGEAVILDGVSSSADSLYMSELVNYQASAGSRYTIMDAGGLSVGYQCRVDGYNVDPALLVEWEQGTINYQTGAEQASEASVRTEFIFLSGTATFRATNGYTMLFRIYDRLGNFVRVYSGEWLASATITADGYIRAVLRKSSSANVTPAQAMAETTVSMYDLSATFEGVTPPLMTGHLFMSLSLTIFAGRTFDNLAIYPGLFKLPGGTL